MKCVFKIGDLQGWFTTNIQKLILLLTEIPFLLLLDCYSCPKKKLGKFEIDPIIIVILYIPVAVPVSLTCSCTWTAVVNHARHSKILDSVNLIKTISCCIKQ